jgi:ATP/maltotriose-dependent transcriptional regulator MalT
LIICLARLELLSQRPAWGGGRRNASTILLSPLSEAESRALVQARSKTISELNAEGIVERAEGNPLFIEQLLALFEEMGELRPGAIPLSIQGVLAARLDRIEPDEREVLDHGAVIGLEFWTGAIANLMQRTSEEIDELLTRLTEKEFLRAAPSELQGEEAYRFRHGLLRDVDYQSVPKAIRADVHERFAKWLEDSHPDEGDSDEIAGHHLEHAYRYSQELDLDAPKVQALALEAGLRFRIAGSRVLLRSDMAAASRLLERALDLWPEDHPERGQILSMLGPACRAMGQWAKAERAVDEGLRFAERRNDEVLKSQLRIRRLETRLQQGGVSVREAESQAKVEIERLKRAGATYEFNEGLVVVAWLRALQGQATEAEKTLRELLGSTRLALHVRLRALRLLPSQWLYGPLPAEEGIARCRHLLTRQELGHRELAALHRSLAALTAMQGNLDEARALIADEEEKLSSLGLALVSAGALLVRAEIEMVAGEMQAAEMLLREGLRRLQALGETLIAAEFAVCLARVVALRGDLDESWELARASTDVKTFDVAVPVQRNSTIARILAERGLHTDALDKARKATRLALKTDLVNLQADAFRDLGDVIQISTGPAKARPSWKRALLLYELKGNAQSAAEIKQRLKP